MVKENKNQESDTNQPLNMHDKAEQSPSYDSTPNTNQHQPPPSTGALNQWQQLPYPQQTHIYPAPPFWPPQPPAPGGPFFGAYPQQIHIYPMLNDTSWQANSIVPAGISSTSQTLVPNMCYPPGYTYPGLFTGPCDPSSYLGQMYQMHNPNICDFPGAPGSSSVTPRMPGCLASGEQSVQKGIIKPSAKLSQKHQQLWDAQSMENAQLWSQINKLQTEVSDYKDRLAKLEEEVSSLQQKKVEVPSNEGFRVTMADPGQPVSSLKQKNVEVPSNEGFRIIAEEPGQPISSLKQKNLEVPSNEGFRIIAAEPGQPVSSLKQKNVEVPSNEGFRIIAAEPEQPKKRGRPRKRPHADALPQSHPQPQGGMPAWPKLQFDTESPLFEKVVLKKADNKGTTNNSLTTMAPQEINRKTLNVATNVSDRIQINQSNPIISAYQGQVHKEYQRIQKCGSEPALVSTSGVQVNFEKNRNVKLAYSEQPPADKVLNNIDVTATYTVMHSQDTVRDVLDVGHQSFFQNGSFIQNGDNITPECNIANEEDASEEMEDAIEGLAKDENEEEMVDNISSDAEENGVTEE